MKYEYLNLPEYRMSAKKRIKKIREQHEVGASGNPVTNEEIRWLCDEVKREWMRGWKKGWAACENRRKLMDTLGKIKTKVCGEK